MEINTKNHWDTIYNTKQSNEVSWTQDVPTVSLEFIRKLKILKDASIIDIGGGDSKLVDFLLKEGYSNIFQFYQNQFENEMLLCRAIHHTFQLG